MILEPHSTRLFPKNFGADQYAITGLASRCDWVILSDRKPPNVHLHRNCNTDHPRHIFLSLRAPFEAILFFFEDILPKLSADFVLVSGSVDATVPRQIDARWRQFSVPERDMINHILCHPKLKHWYAENLDQAAHPKLSPLPLGLMFPKGYPEGGIIVPEVPPISKRPLKVFCAHRHREGAQWEPRRRVSDLATGPWAAFTTHPEIELPEAQFFTQIEAHSFVLCVEGGGLDPSPKAWSTLLNGAIPIIRKNSVSLAYMHLPIVMVDDWQADALRPDLLWQWRDTLQTWFDDAHGRREVIRRMSLDYWCSFVATGTPITDGEIGLHGMS
ncbi:hypothetical protein [Sulfitobacter sp.]|uniref:hypothetical protein n=1 Tax=Sulfitobacter sp. TaxID=1903071 RepID=UPI00300167ED